MKNSIEAIAKQILLPENKIDTSKFHRLLNQELRGIAGLKTNRHQNPSLTEIILPADQYVVLTAGFHPGPEPQPIVSLLAFVKPLLQYARERAVGIICYPLVNEQGAKLGKRYSTEAPNNDVLRFDGDPNKDILGFASDPHQKIVWSLAPDLGVLLPPETRKLVELLKPRLKAGEIKAFIDCHVDYADPGEDYFPPPGTYAFSFEDVKKLIPALQAIKKQGILVIDNGTQVQGALDELVGLQGGFVHNYHDGSFINWAHLSGVPIAVTPEVVDTVPLNQTAIIYWHWATFAISSAAKEPPEQWQRSVGRLKIT